MKLRFFVLLVSVVALPAIGFGSGSDRRGETELQGTWSLFSVEINGRPLPMDKIKDAKLMIHGEEYFFKLGDAHLEMTHKVDTSKSPKTLDMTIIGGNTKGKTYHAIYELKGDFLKICRHIDPDRARPVEFATSPNSGLMITVWKHIGP
jgi:uncharacterized protein (TIGR03067 family)